METKPVVRSQGSMPSDGPDSRAPFEAPVRAEEPLVTIGDIVVSQSWVVTPSGTQPVGAVSWSVSDMTTTTTNIPVWAIICTIVFVWFFLLGLLFLLAKQTETRGVVQVSVVGPGFSHFTQIPVSHPAAIHDINGRVNYGRSLSAAAQQVPLTI